jgi:hypothetical protein
VRLRPPDLRSCCTALIAAAFAERMVAGGKSIEIARGSPEVGRWALAQAKG